MLRARPTLARPRRPLPRRHRRLLAEERARRRGRGRADASFVDRHADGFAALAEPLGLVVRRLHPHEPRPPPPSGGRTALAGVRRARRPLPARRTRAAYCVGLRAVLRRRRARRRPLPRARHAGGHRGRDELVLPPLAPTPTASIELIETRRARHRAGAVPRRGARVPQRRAERHQRVAFGRPGPWLGHPGARRPDPGDLRLVRRAHELHQRARLRRPGQPDVRTMVAGCRRAHPRRRQGHHPLPRRVLAGVPAVGRRAAPDPHPRPPLPHRRRRQALQVLRRRCLPDGARRSATAKTHCAGGSPAMSTPPATPTSPSTASSPKRTRRSPMVSAMPSTGSRRCVTGTSTQPDQHVQNRSTGTATGLQADVATALANFDRRGATDRITRRARRPQPAHRS